jgi:hypothetical protein
MQTSQASGAVQVMFISLEVASFTRRRVDFRRAADKRRTLFYPAPAKEASAGGEINARFLSGSGRACPVDAGACPVWRRRELHRTGQIGGELTVTSRAGFWTR